MTGKQNIEDQLSDLFDDPSFKDIDARFRRFNLFEAVGAVRNELRHSNFLAYLLSPGRPHGLGSTVLERFVRTIVSTLPRELRPIGILDIMTGDLDSAIVERERDNIDVLIEIQALKFVVVIENKVGSQVTAGQLSGYKEIVLHKYKSWRHLFVLLNPDGSRPEEFDDGDYVTFSYSDLATLLAKYLDDLRSSLSDEIVLVLRNYVDALRRHIVEDTELQEKARLLYSKHKDAFDYIFSNMPQPDELLEPLDNVIKADPIFAPDRASPRRIRFALSEWQELPELNSCPPEKWTRSKRNLLFELQAHRSSRRINIHLILGPSEDAFRKYIFSEACKLPSIFINPTKPLGKDTSAIYVRDLLSDGAASKMSDEAKAVEILAAWKNFVNRDLVSLRSEIARLVESYKEHASKPKVGSSP